MLTQEKVDGIVKNDMNTDQKLKIIETALNLAVEMGWDRICMRDIAEKSGISLADLRQDFDDKYEILACLGRLIDTRVLQSVSDSTRDENNNITERDRLFEILMDRFDTLNDYRDGIIAILESFKYDPKQALISLPHLFKSMAWMLEAAHIETTGIKGAAKIAGLTGVYLKILMVWKDDTSPDLSKTMSSLDKALERIEKTALTLGF